MEYQIDIRPFQPEDQEALAGVIRRTWQYDRFCGPKTAQRLGRVYLRQCLTQQTFTRVAVVDGVPVGIIMGKNERTHRCPWSLRWRAARAVLALLSRCPQSYPGQVAFFAVDQPRRGMGLGKRLFQAVMDNMRQEGIGTVFLFTDTSCNYGFYEHQGMVRRAEQTQRIWLGQESGEMTFFVYDYTLAG